MSGEGFRTVGVDLAAADERTFLAELDWTADGATVRSIRGGIADQQILDAVAGANKTGIDCPLGWPQRFTAFVSAYRGDIRTPDPDRGYGWRRSLAYRMTDEVVRSATGLIPLSVAADRIALPALRAAVLLGDLARAGQMVDRAGSGCVVEVYPAAALRIWGLTHRGYKRAANRIALGESVLALRAAAPWLAWSADTAGMVADSDDAFDAVIAALAAGAVQLGLATVPGPDQAAAATEEGWIALPTVSLAELGSRLPPLARHLPPDRRRDLDETPRN